MRNVIILGTGGGASEVTFFIEDNNSKLPESEKINILGYIDYEENLRALIDGLVDGRYNAGTLFDQNGDFRQVRNLIFQFQ